MNDIVSVVNSSIVTGVNVPQLVGTEQGITVVDCQNWHAYLEPSFKPLQNIKLYHHFRFTSAEPGVVYAKMHKNSPEECFKLARSKKLVFNDRPDVIPSLGMDSTCQSYLYTHIRDFCTNETKDLVCTKPRDGDRCKPKFGPVQLKRQCTVA